MKIDRLIGILSILLQREKVTAPYLAEKFEVSRRTINRDIEDLCKAGIPLVTMQGKNGGITVMDGFRIDRTVLTSSEMKSILAGLGSLDSISGTKKYRQLMEKLSAGNSEILPSNQHILIDLSSWYKAELTPKIELLQNAIETKTVVTFRYHSPSGESRRKVEPYLLVFQWSSWYLWGYSLEREDYRLFKLNRMLELEKSEIPAQIRELPAYTSGPGKVFTKLFDVEAVFDSSVKWRLIDEFGVESFTEQEDGTLLFRTKYSDEDYFLGWILTFGDKAELIQPAELRKELAVLLRNMSEKYNGDI